MTKADLEWEAKLDLLCCGDLFLSGLGQVVNWGWLPKDAYRTVMQPVRTGNPLPSNISSVSGGSMLSNLEFK